MRMVETMASLDWSPVLDCGRPGWRPAMVTVTLPGKWADLVPTSGHWRAIIDRFRKRWEREHGDLAGVWKDEFQRRGAPHAHIYCAVGSSRAMKEWVALAWTNSVFGTRAKRRDGEDWDAFIDRCRGRYERRWVDSLLAGTSIDWSEGIRASDPKRLAVYFLKRASGHNASSGKEYQNRPPAHWLIRAAGPYRNGEELARLKPSVGRFWGYWRLEKVTDDAALTEGEFVQLRRLMRRWAKSGRRRCTGCEGDGRRDQGQGPVECSRCDGSGRESTPLPWLGNGRMSGGMLLLNDGPAFFAQASVWLASLGDRKWSNLEDRLDALAIGLAEDSSRVPLDDEAAAERVAASSSKGTVDHHPRDCGSLCMEHFGVVVVDSVSEANGKDGPGLGPNPSTSTVGSAGPF